MTTHVCKATLLKSMKKGKTPVQCSHKAKNGTDYCGYHRNFITKKDLPPPPPPPSTDSIECVICLSDITTNMVKTKCNHRFHSKCLVQWKKRANTCPCCRNVLKRNRVSDLDRLSGHTRLNEMDTLLSLRDNALDYSNEISNFIRDL